MRAQSRENWRAYRENLKDNLEKAQGKGKDHGLEQGEDDKPSKGKGHSRDGPDDDFGI
jgi:hypothetical protein